MITFDGRLSLFALEGSLLRHVRDLADAEGELYTRAVDHLQRFDESDLLCRIVKRNHLEFDQSLGIMPQATRSVREANEESARIQERMNARLLNFLSAFRLFLDHSETRLKRQYGDSSGVVATFKQACSRSYDEVFAYRFLYKLRNYVQHCGLPLGDIATAQRFRSVAQASPDSPLRCTLDVAALLRDGVEQFGRLVEELRVGPPLYEVSPLLDSVTGEIFLIEHVVSGAERPLLETSALTIQEIVRAAAENGGYPVVAFTHRTSDRNVFEFKIPPAPLMRSLGIPEYFDLDVTGPVRPAG
jgi:hypothetical protein